jgi:hypothetical protein
MSKITNKFSPEVLTSPNNASGLNVSARPSSAGVNPGR